MSKRTPPARKPNTGKPTRAPRKAPAKKSAPEPVVEDEPSAEAAPSSRARAAQTIKISTEVAGKIVGLSGRQLQNLKIEGCPLPDGGVRTLEEIRSIVLWRMDQIRKDAGDDRDVDDLEVEEKRTALKVKQLKLAKELDLVLDADEYLHHLSTLWVEMNSLLDIMGTQLAPLLVSIDEADVIADKIDDFVADLKKRFNPDEAMTPVRIDHDPFGDDVAEISFDDDDDDDGE